IKDLKIAGRMFKKEKYEHSYPFCWRCHSPLIYIARQSWYLKTTQFKQKLIDNNNSINWVPDEIRSGRMLNWLENNVDWSLSRERFWGTPIPIWVCDDDNCDKKKAIGSIEEMLKEANDDKWQKIYDSGELDLHKPMMDDVKFTCQCGSSMTRIPEVVDVWFDSGAMPFAQWHYPFENKEEFENKYPADFISEAVDQTRGWFYSLLAISTLLFDKAPFKNVVVLEFILDKAGKKMSKHKGNVVDPFVVVDKYGADAVRWYMVSASNPWLPTRFDENGLGEVVRKFFDTLKNTYSFFAIYANIDGVLEKAESANQSLNEYLQSKAGQPERFDRWIISKYNSLIKEVTAQFDKYEIMRATRAVQYFLIEELSNWYVRNNRRRYWAKGDDPSKMRAYLTLVQCLQGVCQLIAPVAPFMSELIWRELTAAARKSGDDIVSVHMTQFPKADESAIDLELEETMELVEKIVSLGRAARSRKNIKVRQPLGKLLVELPAGTKSEKLKNDLAIIKSELNIKEVEAAENLDQYLTYTAKLNFKTAGPKLGGAVKQAAAMLSQLTETDVKKFVKDGSLKLSIDGKDISLSSDEVEVIKNEKDGFAVESNGGLTVALTTLLTADLIDEGFARELVNKIQNMRKSSGYEVTDFISVRIKSTDKIGQAAKKHSEFIKKETLAESFQFSESETPDGATEWNINGEKTLIALAKV
ncbi:MAG: isoleucine--tRNA ligase, partial [candidate division Zixibacteria bacterium]|nr:isoleucine--tRNA ligase [candidate division Zixibacteria bacterium]